MTNEMQKNTLFYIENMKRLAYEVKFFLLSIYRVF